MDTPPTDYRCPGDSAPISRAIHIGRLAAWFPGCRECVHRSDTGTLSPRFVRQFREAHPSDEPFEGFHDEGFAGRVVNQVRPATARELAAALGGWLHEKWTGDDPPAVIVASDGRPAAADLLAAAAEGLRFAGCRVVDLGSASSPAVALAIEQTASAGGLLIGNSSGQSELVGLTFWGPGSEPVSTGGGLEEIARRYTAGGPRHGRVAESLTRFSIVETYLSGLSGWFHALRPLRFVLDTASGPVWSYWERLSANTACEAIPIGGATAERPPAATNQASLDRFARRLDALAGRIQSEAAHFGVWIDGDGERAIYFDERGWTIAPGDVLALVANHVRSATGDDAPIVVDPLLARSAALRDSGEVITSAGNTRRAMHDSMRAAGAVLGGDAQGRAWFAAPMPVADALRGLALMLNVLSQTDQTLSEAVGRLTLLA